MTWKEPRSAGRAVAQRLKSLERAGVTHVTKPKARAVTAAATRPSAPVKENADAACGLARPAAPGDDCAAALAQVARRVSACVRCAELARTRTQTVFGDGNPHARLVFMGEAPGADEDRQGKPFVGRAGQLLTDIIEKGMKLPRKDVYILNTLKCRPPGNRTPAPDEVANCREYLDGQLAIIQPRFICCLGAVAAQSLLDTTVSIGKLRGRLHDFHGIKVLCTYHPAYLLRNPDAKRLVWDDIRLLMAEMCSSRSA
jgi:uracil-DNA glycosylase